MGVGGLVTDTWVVSLLLLLCCISPGQPGGSLLQEEHMLGSFLLSASEFVFYLDDDFSIFFQEFYVIFEDALIVAFSDGVPYFRAFLKYMNSGFWFHPAESAVKVVVLTFLILCFRHDHGRPSFQYGIALFSR